MSLPVTDPAAVFLVLAAVILVAPIVAEQVRVPGIIGLIVAGTIVGPHGLGVLERDGAIALLGGVGLLYLMFLGGVDLDRHGISERPRDSVVFGVVTFVLPMALLTGVALWLGLPWLGALLLASAFTSHTPITLPLVRRFGLNRKPAVTATLGATLLAVTGALLVLAIVVAHHQGATGPRFWAQFAASLTAFTLFTLMLLPRITRWFFKGLGQDRNVRFTFVLVVCFGLAFLADSAGIAAIVGAFLAGLAINRFVAPGGILMERIQFLGSSLLVPLFLVSTGMLVDPAALVGDVGIVTAGVALTGGTIVAKAAAAWVTGLALRLPGPDRGLMFSLTVGQAAGALAAVIVGAEIGLLDERTVNAAILVLLGTCLVAAFVGHQAAPRVEPPQRRAKLLGETIVVPVANPGSAGALVKLAALVAGPDNGSVIPVNVLGFDAPAEVVDEHRALAAEAERVALANGAEASGQVRIDASPTAGVLHTVIEQGASCVLMGWKGFANARENFFGGVIDAILSQVPVPMLVCRAGGDPSVERVVLSVTHADVSPGSLPGLELAMQVATRMSRQAGVPLVVVTEREEAVLSTQLTEVRKLEIVVDRRRPADAVRERAAEGDVVILPTPPTQARLGHHASRLARAIPDRTLIAVVSRGGQ